MLLETIRAIAAAAADNTIGVNAQIAALTLDTHSPADTAPPNVTIYNAVDDQWVARRAIAENETDISFPALAIYLHSPAQLEAEVETITRDGEFPIGLAVLTKKSDSALGMRDSLYTTRAILRFLRQFELPANDTMRQRNGVHLLEITTLLQPQVYEAWGTAMVAGFVLPTWKVRETSP